MLNDFFHIKPSINATQKSIKFSSHYETEQIPSVYDFIGQNPQQNSGEAGGASN